MKHWKRLKSLVCLVVVFIFSFSLVACKGENKEVVTNDKKSKGLKGTEITALLPPWYKFPKDMLDKFTEETGIKVKLEITDWESMIDKTLTSLQAGVAPADITEMSWHRVQVYGNNGWFEPLKKYFNDDFFSDIATMNMFKYKDDYLAVPIYNDFRMTYVNKKYLEKAGIKQTPKTPEEMVEDCIKIKEKDVCKYPLTVPFSATTASTTPWFLLTKAYGGELFSDNWEPLFEKKDSAGYKAMELLMKSLHDYKIVDPASVGLKGNDIVDTYKTGKSAIDFAGWSGNVSLYKNPKKSKIVDEVEVIPVPGKNGKSRTYGLQEALAIPSYSKNKEAAAEFIKWLNKPENVKRLFVEMGIFPNHKSTVEQLSKEGKMPGADTVLKVMTNIECLFPQGAPDWYEEFRTEAATVMNQMAKGSLSLDEGIKQIADKTKKIVKENKDKTNKK